MMLPLILYGILFAAAVLSPIRWSIVFYVLLSVVDFNSGSASVGVLNALKGLAYPLYLLWRLRAFPERRSIPLAPAFWLLFVAYVGAACAWSDFPLSACKLVAELLGSFLICLAFLRASRAGFLSEAIALPASLGVLAIALLKLLFLPAYGEELGRFSGFTPAQAFASLLAALFALSLCSRSRPVFERVALCLFLAVAIVLNGSRIWTLGLACITLLGLMLSNLRNATKIFLASAFVLTALLAIVEADPILSFLEANTRSNRLADTITALSSGDQASTGLGTYVFRRNLNAIALQSIETSSFSELAFGHGTSNGRLLTGEWNKGVGDPNRAMHNEWLRIFYEWGIIGSLLFLLFLAALTQFALRGLQAQTSWYAHSLVAYLPAFLAGLAVENILAGAGHAANIGILLLIALAAKSRERSFSSHANSASSQLLPAARR